MAIQTIQVLDAWSLAGHCSSQCVLISPLPWRFSRSRVRHVVHKIVWSLLEESPWLGLYRASQIEMLSDRADNRHRRISESFPGGWSSEAEPLCWLYRRRSNSEAFYAPPRQLLPVLCEYLSEFNHKRFNSSPIDHWNKWKFKKNRCGFGWEWQCEGRSCYWSHLGSWALPGQHLPRGVGSCLGHRPPPCRLCPLSPPAFKSTLIFPIRLLNSLLARMDMHQLMIDWIWMAIASNLVDGVFIDDVIEAGEDRVHASHGIHDVAGRHRVRVSDFSEKDRHAFEGLFFIESVKSHQFKNEFISGLVYQKNLKRLSSQWYNSSFIMLKTVVMNR